MSMSTIATSEHPACGVIIPPHGWCLTPARFWRLGAIFGLIFPGALLGIGVPLLLAG
jgi:hypothetical protein